jgi:hypothetical protein
MKGVWANENALADGGADWSPRVVPFLVATHICFHPLLSITNPYDLVFLARNSCGDCRNIKLANS